MQPQTLHKPVMDIAAPPKPLVPAAPAAMPAAVGAAAPAPVSTPAPVSAPAVHAPAAPAPRPTPAPVGPTSASLTVQDAPAPAPTPAEAAAAMPTPPVPHAGKAFGKHQKVPGPQNNESHAPVAIITATVLIMLVLSGLAVVIYFTSQSL